MRQYIKKLQSKSEDTRKLIMVGSLIACMAFVSFVWIYNLGTRFGDPEVATQADEDIKPFKLFSNSLSDTYKNISASVGKAKISDEVKNNTEIKEENKVDLIPVEYNN